MAVERVITITFGTEALGRFMDAMTGNDDDVLLAVEKTIEDVIGTEDLDPHTDALGVWVDGFRLPA